MSYGTTSEYKRKWIYRARQKAREEGLCTKCFKIKIDGKVYCTKCREGHILSTRKLRAKRRIEVINHYGGKCLHCGDTRISVLDIDHINGDGAFHRKVVKATNLPQWLIQNNYPEGFQILCANCHRIKHFGDHAVHVYYE